MTSPTKPKPTILCLGAPPGLVAHLTQAMEDTTIYAVDLKKDENLLRGWPEHPLPDPIFEINNLAFEREFLNHPQMPLYVKRQRGEGRPGIIPRKGFRN